jgi:DNA-binding LacI/PurR family transcriptional regulator
MAIRQDSPAAGPLADGRPMINIREIARRAGVSLGTVSHVLNHPHIVREPLRRKVQEVIDQYGYRPNAVAKSLREKKTRTIGLVLSDITTAFAGKLARAIEDIATESNMSLAFADTDERIEREESAVNMFVDKGVDGLILAPAPGPHLFLRPYLARGLPMVAINRMIAHLDMPAVLPGNAEGAIEATRHLVSLGHRRIGIITPRIAPLSSRERLDGHRRALRAAGIPYGANLVIKEAWSEEGGATAVGKLLSLQERPTAILSFSSAMTLGAIVALRESGVVVPHDMALVGFDEAEWSKAVSPPLTTVDLRAREVGETAARLLLDWIDSRKPPVQNIWRVPTVLVRRASCGSAAAQPTGIAAPERTGE